MGIAVHLGKALRKKLGEFSYLSGGHAQVRSRAEDSTSRSIGWVDSFEEADMWTRRLLLATMVAACALSLPKHAPSSWNVFGTSHVAVTSMR